MGPPPPGPDLISAYRSNGANDTSVGFGPEPGVGERRYIVAVSTVYDSTPALNGPTIAGIAATIVHQTASGSEACGIFYAEVPTGTAGVVNANWTSGGSKMWNSVFSIIAGPDGIAVEDVDTSSGTNPTTYQANVAAGGSVILGYQARSGGSNGNWSGITERFKKDLDSAEMHIVASDDYGVEQTPGTFTYTPTSGAPSNVAGALGSFAKV